MNVRVLGTEPGDAQPDDPARTSADPDDADSPDTDDAPVSIGDRLRHLLSSGGEKEAMYPRVLRLRHVHPNGWQRALLLEGMMLVGALVALADRATAWAPLVLPAGAAAVVKFHDVLAGALPQRPRANETAASPEGEDAAAAERKD